MTDPQTFGEGLVFGTSALIVVVGCLSLVLLLLSAVVKLGAWIAQKWNWL